MKVANINATDTSSMSKPPAKKKYQALSKFNKSLCVITLVIIVVSKTKIRVSRLNALKKLICFKVKVIF
jgi:hypothetical protein